MTVDSLAIARWIANGVFVVLLLRAWIELRPRTAILFALLWLAGWEGLPFLLWGRFFAVYVVLLDVALWFRLRSTEHAEGLGLR